MLLIIKTIRKTYNHVNQHAIWANRKNNASDAVITMKQGTKNTYCSGVKILGPSEVIHRGNGKPLLGYGARVVIATDSEVEIVE